MKASIKESRWEGFDKARNRPNGGWSQQENVVVLETRGQRRPMDPYSGKGYEFLRTNIFSSERLPTSAYPRGRLTGHVQFLSKLLELWHLKSLDACILLGYENKDQNYVEAILSGTVTLRGRDAKDRIINLFKIRRTLSSIFRDLNVENAWLREPQKVLNDQTPLQLLQEGSIENLLRVRFLVEHMGGL